MHTKKMISLAILALLTLSACSEKEAPASPAQPAASAPTTAPAQPAASAPTTAPSAASTNTPAQTDSLARVAATAKGFAIGPMLSANVVYVFFDPQCPHCGHLWEAAKPLEVKTKFIWVPVAFGPKVSVNQAAVLLAATDPMATMNQHEALLLARTGGIEALEASAEVAAAVKLNGVLLTELGVESVPFVIAKNAKSGLVVSQAGALPTQALADFLGLTTH